MEDQLNKIKFEINKISSTEDNAKYKVSIKVPKEMGFIEQMKFIAESDSRYAFQLNHLKNEDGYIYFEGEVELPTRAVYNYYFSFNAEYRFIYLKKENKGDVNNISKSDMWKLSVNYDQPEWAKGAIMYHIFVDRFNRGSKEPLVEMKNRTIHKSWDEEPVVGPDENGLWTADFYGGDLRGIIEKLDYIKSLGTSIIYLSPIVKSQSNHRYDTADYEEVDPYAGTKEDLKELCDKAHELGIKIILDAVFNHTGNDSKYFNEYGTYPELGAFQSKESPYFEFYRTYENHNQIYFDYWWTMKNLPQCDGTNKKWQEYIYGEGGVIDQWFSLGIDGLRLDVADNLTDEFIEGIRRAVKRNKPDGFIIGEVWENPMHMNRGYISSGKGMDSVMNYSLMDAMIRYFKYEDVTKLRNILNDLLSEYPEGTLQTLMNFTSTHDISRAINILGTKEFNYNGKWAWDLPKIKDEDREYQRKFKMTDEEYRKGIEVYKTLIFALTFFPGILSIFYGDEVGVEGLGNLANRKSFPWGKENTELLDFFRTIGRIREKEQTLKTADTKVIDINPQNLIFQRTGNDSDFLVAINRSSERSQIYIPERFKLPDYAYSLFDSTIHETELDGNLYFGSGELPSHGALVLKKKK